MRGRTLVFGMLMMLGLEPSYAYNVDGIELYQRLPPQILFTFRCAPSSLFVRGFSWCRKETQQTVGRGTFTNHYSALLSPTGQVIYAERELDPAWFSGNEAQDDVDRLSKKYGPPSYVIRNLPHIEHGMIVVWGNVTLELITDQAILSDLANTRPVHVGLMVTPIRDLNDAARMNYPIFRIAGGPGFIWTASWNGDGVGHLQFQEFDPTLVSYAFPMERVGAVINNQATADHQFNSVPAVASPSQTTAPGSAQELQPSPNVQAPPPPLVSKLNDAVEPAQAAPQISEEAQAQQRLAEQKSHDEFYAANDTQWKYIEDTDQMTGETVARAFSRQGNGSGVAVEVTAKCDARLHEVDFTALIVDNDGNPTIQIGGRNGKTVAGRYRLNSKYSPDMMIPSIEYNNEFLVFSALNSEKAAKDMLNGIYGVAALTQAIIGKNQIPFFAYYKTVWAVLAEFNTNHDKVIIKVPVEDPAIQRVYNSCFGKAM